MRPAPLAIWLALGLALLAATAAHAQVANPVSHMPFPQPIGQSVGGGLDDDRSEPDQIDAARRYRALNDMRQKALVSDTNKLLKLANELDAEIRKANSGSLTPDQLHKLATIEKLARSVKEHMSTPVANMPAYHPPSAPIMR
jgi:hypothetical protein